MGIAGKTVLVTRPGAPGEELARWVRECGGTALLAPAIRVLVDSEGAEAGAARAALAGASGLILTSANGLDALLPPSRAITRPLPPVACVGSSTADRARARGLDVALVAGGTGGAAALCRLMLEHLPAAGARYVWPRGDLARPEVFAPLRAAGAVIADHVVYRTTDAYAAGGLPDAAVLDAVDVVVVASPSAITNLARALAATGRSAWLSERPVVAIGERTAAAAQAAGAGRIHRAAAASSEGLQEALDAAL